MKNRLSLLDLHKAEIKKNMLEKIKGGADIKCLCTFINPLVSTRDSGGSATLCLCNTSTTVSQAVQNRPNT